MNNSIINRAFKTPIGEVLCQLKTDSSDIEIIETMEYENGKSTLYKSKGHRFELIQFKIKQPLYNGERIVDSNGWIWRIKKINGVKEKLVLNCFLNNQTKEVEFDSASGEYLDAIEASNDEWILHIGTEDGEMLNFRAKSNDWFPKRLENKVDLHQSITKMNKEGFKTEIPELESGEQIHIQYLSAYDNKNPDSVNTWLAVDELKRKLENWIGVR